MVLNWTSPITYAEKVKRFREANKNLMGMLDTIVPFNDKFKDGEVFTLADAKVGPSITTDFGDSRPAQLKIGGAWYSIFGQALVNQVERMDNNDRQAMAQGRMRVKVVRGQTRRGNEVKLLVSENTPSGPDGRLLVQTDDIPF